MNLKKLSLKHFRNHTDSSFDFGNKTNIFVGDNGQGKTNVIEAISYLCLTKSFYANSDVNVLNFESEIFEVKGKFVSDNISEYDIRVAFDKQQNEKVYSVNKYRVEPFSSVIGKFPIVICSPEHALITNSGPGERRKFVDLVISQSNSSYFQKLISFRKVLKHRNKILFDARITKQDFSSAIEPWNEQLVNQGSYLISKRKGFVKEFSEYIQSAYQLLVSFEEVPTIEYQSVMNIKGVEDEKEIQDIYWQTLRNCEQEEKKFGTTLVGPHRDEFVFKLKGLEIRKYASQGQHKTFLVALKFGEFRYLKERCNEIPLLLLDDIFSELDEHRSGKLLNFVETLSQTFITTTNPRLFLYDLRSLNGCKVFCIKNGLVEEE